MLVIEILFIKIYFTRSTDFQLKIITQRFLNMKIDFSNKVTVCLHPHVVVQELINTISPTEKNRRIHEKPSFYNLFYYLLLVEISH